MTEQNVNFPEAPVVAVFPCCGMMSSVGTLTALACLEATKLCAEGQMGLYCTSALAANIPKHKKTTDSAARILAVDGCANRCASRIIKQAGYNDFDELNLVKDLGLEKRGPFRSMDHTWEELQRVVESIVARCK